MAQRMEIEELLRSLEGIVQDLEGAAAALSGDEMIGIESELEQAAMTTGID